MKLILLLLAFQATLGEPEAGSGNSLIFHAELSTVDEVLRSSQPLDTRNGTSSAGGLSSLMVPVPCTWTAVEVLAGLTLIATIPILIQDGVAPFFIVILSLCCLTMVKVLVKLAMNEGLRYPYSITAMHMLFTMVAATAADRFLRGEGAARTWAQLYEEGKQVLPISLVTGSSLAMNNTALLFGGVAFVTMLSCGTPATTWAIEALRLKTSIQPQMVLGVFIVCLGGMCCVKGSIDFSVAACCLALGANVCRSMKTVWQHDLMRVHLAPCRLAAWSSFFTFFGMLPLVAAFEGVEGIRQLPSASFAGQMAVLLSAITALTLNVVQCFAVKQQGPVMASVIGNLQLIMVIVLASVWLHETVTFIEWGGVVLLVAGTVLTKFKSLVTKSVEHEPLMVKETTTAKFSGAAQA